jgi:hypothetical protein
MFNGMSLPALLLWTSATPVGWLVNTHTDVPVWLGYCILGSFLAAMIFLLVRMWTYREDRRRSSTL